MEKIVSSQEKALPEKWCYSNIGEVAEVVAGSAFPKNMQGVSHGEIPVFKVGDISKLWQAGDKYLVKSPNYLSINDAEAIRAKMYPRGTTVFAKIGEALRLNRRAVLGQESIVDNNVMGLIPNSDAVEPDYLFYYTQLLDLGLYARATAVPSIRKSDIVKIRIPLAPLQQQKRIVEEIEKQFSRLDEAVENLQRVKANLKRYKAATLKAAVEGKLTEEWRKQNPDIEPASKLLERILTERRNKWEKAELAKMKAKGRVPKDDKWKKKYKEPGKLETDNYPRLPDGWTWATVEQLASDQPRSIQSGPFGSNLKHSEFQKEGKLVIGIDNVQDGHFSFGSENRISESKFEELQKYAARPSDVLITVMATVGRTCVVPKNIEESIITKHVYRISADSNFVLPDYLHLALWGGAFVREQMFGQVVGQTRPGLNGGIIKKLVIPVPTLDEQEIISELVHEKLSIIEEIYPILEKNMQRSERFRQSILQKAFSGELVKQDSNEEPASVLLARIKAVQNEKQPTGKKRKVKNRTAVNTQTCVN